MKQTINFKIQKRVGYFTAISALVILLINIINTHFVSGIPLREYMILIISLLIIAILSFLSTKWDSRVIQLLQVFSIYIFSTISILTYTVAEDLSGDILAFLGTFLAIHQGFFRKRFYFKFFLVVLYTSILKFIVISRPDFIARSRANVQDINPILTYLTYLILIITTLFLCWLIIKEKIDKYINKNRKLTSDIYVLKYELQELRQKIDKCENLDDFILKYKLSKREAEIVELMLQKLPYKEIGARLFISLTTVKSHTQNIFAKIGINSRWDLDDMV